MSHQGKTQDFSARALQTRTGATARLLSSFSRCQMRSIMHLERLSRCMWPLSAKCCTCTCTCMFLRRVVLRFPHHPPRDSSPSPLGSMSHTHPASASSSNFQIIFDDALKVYEKRTKKDLLTHPLAAQLQHCNTPSSILDVLQQQVQELNQSQGRNEKWTRWLDPTVKVLYAFSVTLGEGVTLVCLSSWTCV